MTSAKAKPTSSKRRSAKRPESPIPDERIRNGNRKDLIVRAAVDLFAAHPYEDVSVDDVCDRAGVAHGLVSYHFKSKRGLLAAAVEWVWDDMEAFQLREPDGTTPDNRLRESMQRHFAYIEQHRDWFLLTVGAVRAFPENEKLIRSSQMKGVCWTCEVLEIDISDNAYLRAALMGWVGFTHEVTMEWLSNGGLSADTLADLCLDALFSAISAPDRVRGIAADSRTTPDAGLLHVPTSR